MMTLPCLASQMLHQVAQTHVKRFQHNRPQPYQLFVFLLFVLMIDLFMVFSFGHFFLDQNSSCLAKFASITALTQPGVLLSDFFSFYLVIFDCYHLFQTLSLKAKKVIGILIQIICKIITSINMLIFTYYILQSTGKQVTKTSLSSNTLLLVHCIPQLLFSLFNIWQSIMQITRWQEEHSKFMKERLMLLTTDIIEDCTICWEALSRQNAKQLSCGHCYHEKCIYSWLNYKSDCPICRHNIL